MAPESIRDKRYDHRTDCFSFATLMWECFSWGETPFSNLSNLETVLAVGTGRRLARPNACPKQVYALMKQMWSLDPEQRPGFAFVLETLRSAHLSDDEVFGVGHDHQFDASASAWDEPVDIDPGHRYISDEQTASISASGRTVASERRGSLPHYVSFGAGDLASAPSAVASRRAGVEGHAGRIAPALPEPPLEFRVSTAV